MAGYNRDLQKNKANVGTDAGSAGKAATTASAGVQLTDKVNELRSSLSAEAPVDAKRVDEIKTAIREGRYAINYEKLAEKMVEMEFGLGSKD